MIKKLFSSFIILFLIIVNCNKVNAQFKIKGTVKDLTENKTIPNAIVYLLQPKDSIIQSFVRTNNNGDFIINTSKNESILLVTSTKYADYYLDLKVKTDQTLPVILMTDASKMLQEIIIKRQANSITQKGDTISYDAKSFKVSKGANVEELLKRLPGVVVDKDGNITAQGETVNKVLVDGEEFFGNDPTVATRNLSAASITKVEIFDKKSDQANFTGVDDGQKQRTINLKLKEDAKKGYFGKVQVAGGLPRQFENTAFFNNFKAKQKFSLLAIASNTGKAGLSRNEERNFGGRQTGSPFDFENASALNDDGNNNQGNFGGQGLPTNYTVGGQLSDKFNKDRSNYNANTRFQQNQTQGNINATSIFILPNSSLTNKQETNFRTDRWKQSAQAKGVFFIDSTQTITSSLNFSFGESKNNESRTVELLDANNTLINKNLRNFNTDAKVGNLNSTILWQKKFKRPKRTFSFNVEQSFNSNKGVGFLSNLVDATINPNPADNIDLFRDNSTTNYQIDNKLAYTEPFGKNGLIQISIGYGLQRSNNSRSSFNKLNNQSTIFDTNFSNDTDFNINNQRLGLSYRYNFKKITWEIGSEFANTKWKVTDPIQQKNSAKNFDNILPRASLNIKTSTFGGVDIAYSGKATAPTLSQVNALVDNSDPLSIVTGNPNLEQSFTNSYSIRYNVFKPSKQRAIQISLRYSQIDKAFSQRDFIDNLGRRIIEPINIDGNSTLSFFYFFYSKLKKIDADINFNLRANKIITNNILNNLPNKNTNITYGGGVTFNKSVPDDFSFSLNLNADYNQGESSLRNAAGQKFWTSEPRFDFTYFLPFSFKIITDFTYQWRQTTPIFTVNNNISLWNARIERKISKKGDFKLGFRINDILNQNIGFTRFVNSNFIAENNFDTIRRYWMITLNWNFNKGLFKEEGDF